MYKNTTEGKTISEWAFDVLVNVFISDWKFVCKFTTNIDKMCIQLMRNTTRFGIGSIINN